MHAGLVDAHVPQLAACLCDEHELVRCQALALLSHLLQKVCRAADAVRQSSAAAPDKLPG